MMSFKRQGFVCAVLSIILFFSFSLIKVNASSEFVYLGGMPAGFSMYTRGADVVGLCDVVTEKGIESPAKDIDIKVGDKILFINEFPVDNAFDIEKALIKEGDKNLTIERNGEIFLERIKPVKDLSGKYKLGLFVRDEVSGIGTVTFIKGKRFASLGHPVVDEDGKILKITGGKAYSCNITGYVKGERGKAGELRGVFLRNNFIAQIDKNTEYGVYGNISECLELTKLKEIKIGQAKMGDAYIYSTIDGKTPKYYSISIIKVDNSQNTKNFVIKINDKELISSTGGIVQGMSGSPIVQNGSLVGAVTHVFINDPTRGFGLSIDKMLNFL